MPHTNEEMIEKMASIEHERWAKWQKYMHSHVYDSSQSINPHLKVIPTELYNRWERQINTPYEQLSEKEKESDREQVRPYFELISNLKKSIREEIEKVEAPIFEGATGFTYNAGWNDGEKSARYNLKDEILSLKSLE
jgi:hypothetical protein